MIRILCLGNELLADDACGHVAAGRLRELFPQLDVVFTPDSGFHLIDYLSGIQLLIVIDTIQTGAVPPGTLYVMRGSDIKSPSGPSPHYVGLFETLQLAKKLLHNVPQEVFILAVEAADCLTLGGEMHAAVKSAVELVAELVQQIVQDWKPFSPEHGQDSADVLKRAVATVSARWGPERLVVI